MTLGPARLRALASALERIARDCDTASRLRVDPVGVVRRYASAEERELVGLLASSLAFGNVTALRAGIEGVLDRLGADVPGVLENRKETLRRLSGFKYRMITGRDIGRLLCSARAMQRRHGNLGDAFAGAVAAEGGLRGGLVMWTTELRHGAAYGEPSDRNRRGPVHVLPDPSGASACKRLLLYLRWMVRPDDGVDLGLWPVSPSLLLIPVDTHIHRLATNLGMTDSRGASWRAAEEITGVLRRIDSSDPVRFDFALCHLGMARGCQGRAEEQRCGGCGAREVCRVWLRDA